MASEPFRPDWYSNQLIIFPCSSPLLRLGMKETGRAVAPVTNCQRSAMKYGQHATEKGGKSHREMEEFFSCRQWPRVVAGGISSANLAIY